MAKSWTDVNEMLEIIFSNETAALVDEGGNSSNKNHDSGKGLIGNASGNNESAESNWEYEEEDLPRPSHAHQKYTAISDSCETSPKRRKYGSNDITADNNNHKTYLLHVLLSMQVLHQKPCIIVYRIQVH